MIEKPPTLMLLTCKEKRGYVIILHSLKYPALLMIEFIFIQVSIS